MLRPGPIPRVSRQDESALARRYERDTGTPSCGISFQPERGSVDVLDRGGEMFGVSVREGDVLSTVPGIDPDVAPSGSGCAECEASGGWWFHLRRCAQCGHIDASPPSMRAGTLASRTIHGPVRTSPARTGSTTTPTEAYEGPDLAPPLHHRLEQPTPGPGGRVPSDWQLRLH